MSTTTDVTELPEGAAAAVREIRDIAQAAVKHEPQYLRDGLELQLVPDGYKAVVTDIREDPLEAEHPDRRRGTVTMQELEPFTRYVNLHRDPNATTVWTEHDATAKGGDARAVGRITGVLDDHAPSVKGATDDAAAAGWGEHRVVLDLVTTPEWQHWLSRDGVSGSQEQLAEHIEDGIAEIVDPPAANLLDVIQTISVTRNVDFKSSARTRDGQIQFAYVEDQEAKAGKRGDLTVPEKITLNLSAFPGGKRVQLTARLRYRLNEGKLSIGYKLERPADVLRQAVEHLHAELLDQLETELQERVFRGQPVPEKVRAGKQRELRFHRPPTSGY
jgi:uncharacterized protein YfdQ (DUF2303 family)